MKINIKQAIKHFYANHSLALVFEEAICNSLDANASRIEVNITVDELDKPDSLKIVIKDDGEGFVEERFNKFCKLLEVDEDTHKGIGRLVYLHYFEKINILSKYGTKQRNFDFTINFDEDKINKKETETGISQQETILTFQKYYPKKLAKYDYIFPSFLKKYILQQFYPKLYLLKKEQKDFEIIFNLNVKNVNKNQVIGARKTYITNKDIPELETELIDSGFMPLFEESEVRFSIVKQELPSDSLLITALCIDDRTFNLSDIISNENIPIGYELIFLFYSTALRGKTDTSRQTLKEDDAFFKIIKKIFRQKISEILELRLPQIKEKNNQTKEILSKNYPHLLGYFNQEEIGFISKSKSIEEAQKQFLKDQKEILEATSLNDEKYEKALEVSSRTLTEYILYREKIISKIEEITHENSETDIHNLILPKRTILRDNSDLTSFYTNNLWLLDDKYMTFTKALSERTMKEVIDELAEEASSTNNKKPDLAIIFSNNIDNEKIKSDVVIVELKKRGIKLAKTEEVISQLKERATKLMKYFPNKIQRIWFYGIVEFNDEFKLSLKNSQYTPLFSKDILYYKEEPIYLSVDDDKPYIIGTYILSIDAFIEDAKARNATFLKILKDGFNPEKS
ncbi:MAG: ATP-binding protein [Bacteroidia bacterium]|nr:ATP-binding protein [Bacteroidia bacterium]